MLTQRRADRFAHVEPKGKRVYTALQRAEMLVDDGSFVPMTPLRSAGAGQGSGVIAGWGTTDGHPLVVVSHDAAVASGAIGAVMAESIQKAQRFAIDKGYPIVYINDSGGARIHDGIFALHGCGGIFALNIEATEAHPADLVDPRSVRRRRGILAGADRLDDHGQGAGADVPDRPRHRQGSHRRGRHR